MIKAIILDIGSTVITRNWKKQRREVNKNFSIDPDFDQKAREIKEQATIGRNSLMHVFKESIKNSGKDISMKKFTYFYKKMYEKTSPIKKSMVKSIIKMRKDYKIYAFSNTFDLHAEMNKKRGLWKLFDKVFLSNEIHLKKPDIKAYLYVLKEINLKPGETIFIDDKDENIKVARDLGIIAIKYTSYKKVREKLKILGVKT